MGQAAVRLEEASTTSPAKSLRSRVTLILNADYSPLAVWPLSVHPAIDAIKMVMRQRADVVEAWPGEFCRSATQTIEVPKVVVIREFAHVYGKPKFTRRNVWLRDNGHCGYCGDPVELSEYTFDHVIPRSKGGLTSWENVLVACSACNAKKADKHPNYSGRKGVKGSLRPLKEPRQPTNSELIRAGLKLLPNDLREPWADYLYWSAPLHS
jgi:5-methylcytosine-specific restriction endonuclease McrA